MPWLVFAVDDKNWAGVREPWILALAVQAVMTVLFVVLQRLKLIELGEAGLTASAPHPAGD